MNKIFLHSSLTNKLEEFKPLKDGEVSIYVCGPTVYNHPHIGNMRPVIVFDAWRRLFLAMGYKVTFVSNYTDVDDKIINRALELGISEKELTESVIEEFRQEVEEVGCLQPDFTPKPTEYMGDIVSYVGDLVDKGFAYQNGGDVYFRVPLIKDYGLLSGNTVDKLVSGARIDVNGNKESPLDFALWKKTDIGIKWETPWSNGRPGWHTECCVMINSLFKDNHGMVDIHGGGFDLKFPHHENEIAQAEAHNGNHLATYWLHNGFVNINNEKMSKSLGNVLLAKDIIAKFGAMPLRLMILNAHYRAPLSFTEDAINEAQKQIERIKTTLKGMAVALQLNNVDLSSLTFADDKGFLEELCNDLNTPNAITILYGEIKNGNQLLRERPLPLDKLGEEFALINYYLETLGFKIGYPKLDDDDKSLFLEYNNVKANKDFAKSDSLRSKLIEKGLL